MNTRFLLLLAAGAFFMLGGSASAQHPDDRYRGAQYDSRCAERIRELERNVAYYERRYGYNSIHARRERDKLRDTRYSCGFDGRDDWRNDRRCAERIRELERNVAYYERRYGFNSIHARRERDKLHDTVHACGYPHHCSFDEHDRGRNRDWSRDRDDRWRPRP
jgi:hypothetical protein